MATRRTFLKKTTLACAGVSLFNIGRAGASPNEMINHASFGADGMALTDIKAFRATNMTNLIAVAEVDEQRVAKVKKLYPDVKVYKDWRELLDKEHKNLDSVNVTTPDHMHAPIGVTAMKLGLHLYGQKPLAQNLFEARRMAEIAKEEGIVTQMGIQFSSSMYERMAARIVQDGEIGKVKEVFVFSHKTWGDPAPHPDRVDPVPDTFDWDLWLGVASERPFIDGHYHPDEWRKRLDFGTGTLGDMGCHLYGPMYQALKLRNPLSVKSTGGAPNAVNWAVDERIEYLFPGSDLTAGDTLKVTWCDGRLRPPKRFLEMFGERMPEQGSIFVGTDGYLLERHQTAPVPFPREHFEGFRYPKLEPRNHYKDFLSAIKGENVVPKADFHTYAGPLTEAILLGALSTRFPGKQLEWDAENLRFKNDKDANKLIRRTYRAGWEVDGLT